MRFGDFKGRESSKPIDRKARSFFDKGTRFKPYNLTITYLNFISRLVNNFFFFNTSFY